MKTTAFQSQRTATTPFAGLHKSVAKLLKNIVPTQDDRREKYLAKSINHGDLAVRERAFEEHAARTRMLFHIL